MSQAKRQILFDGADFSVFAREYGSDVLFVTFTGRREKPEKFGFGEKFLQNVEQSGIFFLSKRNHWWSTPDFLAAIKVVAAWIEARHFKRVVAYGSSMGAHGALLTIGRLPVSEVIVFCPQFSMDPKDMPTERRWLSDVRGIDFSHKQPLLADPNLKPVVLVDPFFVDGMSHVSQLRRIYPSLELVPVAASGHKPANFMKRYSVLGDFMRHVVSEPSSATIIRRLIREGRRRSPLYWSRLGLRCLHRRRILHAETCLKIASRLAFANQDDMEIMEVSLFAARYHYSRHDMLACTAFLTLANTIAPGHNDVQKALGQLGAAAAGVSRFITAPTSPEEAVA